MKKINRVRKSQEFQTLIHTAKKTVNRQYVCYFKTRKEEQARIGISLSKKMGNAVERNKIKRQVRMMCQDLIDFKEFPLDIIIIVRLDYKNNTYADNKNSLEKLFNKATIM